MIQGAKRSVLRRAVLFSERLQLAEKCLAGKACVHFFQICSCILASLTYLLKCPIFLQMSLNED